MQRNSFFKTLPLQLFSKSMERLLKKILDPSLFAYSQVDILKNVSQIAMNIVENIYLVC